MTLDEAIKHCEEVVAKYEKQAFFSMSKEGKKYNCECAEEHKQLLKWLKELKQLKEADVQPVVETEDLATAKYIDREEVIERINKLFTKNRDGSVSKNDYNRGVYAAKSEIVFSKVVSGTQPVNIYMSDMCIVCGRDVRKDMVYYDINGATVCEGCMSVKCKVGKEG